MNRNRHPRIPEEEWERHKTPIKELYLGEGKVLLGEDGLVEIMKRDHNFFARYVMKTPFSNFICAKALTMGIANLSIRRG